MTREPGANEEAVRTLQGKSCGWCTAATWNKTCGGEAPGDGARLTGSAEAAGQAGRRSQQGPSPGSLGQESGFYCHCVKVLMGCQQREGHDVAALHMLTLAAAWRTDGRAERLEGT